MQTLKKIVNLLKFVNFFPNSQFFFSNSCLSNFMFFFEILRCFQIHLFLKVNGQWWNGHSSMVNQSTMNWYICQIFSTAAYSVSEWSCATRDEWSFFEYRTVHERVNVLGHDPLRSHAGASSPNRRRRRCLGAPALEEGQVSAEVSRTGV